MDPIGDTGIDERHDFSARRGPGVVDDHSGTRFSRMRLRSDSENDGKYVGKSKESRLSQDPHNRRDRPTTQTPSRGAQADFRGKQRESPHPESKIGDFSDIDMFEKDDRVNKYFGQLEQGKNRALPPSATVSTMTTRNFPAVVDRFCHSLPQACNNSEFSNSPGNSPGNSITRGPNYAHPPMKFLPGVYSAQRGQDENGLQLARNPVQTEGGDVFPLVYRNIQDEANHLRSENRSLKNELQQSREKYDYLSNAYKRVCRELEDSRRLADVRGRELFGAQEFLTTSDIISVSEIRQKVTELNDEIFQASALLKDSLVHEVARHGTEDEKNSSLEFALIILGELMFDAVTNSLRGGEINPILVQLALQTYLSCFCCEKFETWYEKDENTNDFLVNIYREISRTGDALFHNSLSTHYSDSFDPSRLEEQSVSGRWRAITHAKTRLETDNWAFEFNLGLNVILQAASVAPADPDSLPAFEQKLDPIFRAITNLRTALGEQFTSADITPFVVTSGTPFEVSSMEDALSDIRPSGRGKRNAADVVISTIGIGLKECVSQPACKASKESENLILMPKVVLQSRLTDFLRHSPFPRSD